MKIKKWREMTLKEKIGGIVGSLLIVFIIFIGISLAFGGDKKEAKPEDTSSQLDASAIISCRDFNRAISDVKTGILTNEEFRDKIKKVYDNARLSPNAGIKKSAQDLLKAVTSGTTEDAAEATVALAKACKE